MNINRLLPCVVLLASLLLRNASGAPAGTPALPNIPDATFNIAKYGAVGDGKTSDTGAIQKAIDAASTAGGGTVEIPAGQYLTGPFTLASRINLHLDHGAVILVSDDMAHYPASNHRYQDTITASGVHDLEISGDGVIDGQGAAWWSAFRSNPGMTHRPFLIKIVNCTRLLVTGVTLENSPMFHLVSEHCTDVTIRDIHIHAPANAPNTDGIDPSGWNFLIEGCKIDTGDDDIAIKPNTDRVPGNKNFLIENCTFGHGHGCSIGGNTVGGIEDMTVRNCTFDQTDSGIRIKTKRNGGGLLQNITYENLKMTAVKNPIYIYDYYPEHDAPKNPADARPVPITSRTPVNKNITISNVTATDCPTAGTIYGLPEMPIGPITLSNVNISAEKGMKIYYAHGIRFVNSKIIVQAGKPLITYHAQVTGLQ